MKGIAYQVNEGCPLDNVGKCPRPLHDDKIENFLLFDVLDNRKRKYEDD